MEALVPINLATMYIAARLVLSATAVLSKMFVPMTQGDWFPIGRKFLISRLLKEN